MHITKDQIDAYHDQGYFILESAIPHEQLEGLRSECDRYVETFEREKEVKGVSSRSINHYKKRYFISNRGQQSPIISAFLFGELMADIARATLGDTAYLFNEQYVVKASEVGTTFAWHQDSGYIGHYHRPYLSCWCALDDMSEANGTIFVLPYERAGMSADDLFDHGVEQGSNDRVGYHGDDPGVPAIVPAGSVVVFSSRTFHRSSANSSGKVRRSYLAQYSAEKILNRDGSGLWAQAVPLLEGGRRVGGEGVGP